MNHVFVYATLRPGERNHHYLATATHLGTYTTQAAFALLDTGPYPVALDLLENYPLHYTRRRRQEQTV